MPSQSFLKAIADEIGDRTDQEVFDDLSQRQSTKYRVLNGNELKIWASTMYDDYAAIKEDAASGDNSVSVPAEQILSLIDKPDSKLDLNLTAVNDLLAKVRITTPGVDMLRGMATVSVYDFPNIKLGNIEEARRGRAEGLY